jgi:hypothetical protein
VRGQYLGQSFIGQIIGYSGAANHRQISIRFNSPVDVVRFESFSNLRRRSKPRSTNTATHVGISQMVDHG